MKGAQIGSNIYYLADTDDTGTVGVMWTKTAVVTRAEDIRSRDDFVFWFNAFTELQKQHNVQFA